MKLRQICSLLITDSSIAENRIPGGLDSYAVNPTAPWFSPSLPLFLHLVEKELRGEGIPDFQAHGSMLVMKRGKS